MAEAQQQPVFSDEAIHEFAEAAMPKFDALLAKHAAFDRWLAERDAAAAMPRVRTADDGQPLR